MGVGNAKPLEPQAQSVQPEITQPIAESLTSPQETVTQPGPITSVTSIEGKGVFDENANKIGTAKQVGIDSTQSMVLVITKEDGTEGSIPWSSIKKIGQVVLLGNPEVASQPGKCSGCGFVNKEGSKFCEDCGNKI